MLTTNILLVEKYDYLSEKFKKAFTFLRDTDLAALPVGNVPIDGNEVYANVQSYSTMDAADCPFESHKEYFDVQYVVEGEECFGYEPVENLIPSKEYDAEKDLIKHETDIAPLIFRLCRKSHGRNMTVIPCFSQVQQILYLIFPKTSKKYQSSVFFSCSRS